MSVRASRVLCFGLGALLPLVVNAATIVWYERIWLPRISGDE